MLQNFSFFLEVDDYKKISDPQKRNHRAKEIYQKYFSSESQYEINLTSEIKKEVSSHINTPTQDLFNNAQE